jgi:hypothetical protein
MPHGKREATHRSEMTSEDRNDLIGLDDMKMNAGSALCAMALGFAAGNLFGCGAPDSTAEATPELVTLSQPIFGGSIDNAHPEVMLLLDLAGFLCTGTNIRAEDGTGFLLTAAHCVTRAQGFGVVDLDPDQLLVVPGVDFAQATIAFPVQEVTVEPGYDGSFAVDDIAVVRYAFGDEPTPPAIEPLSAADDDLAVDDSLLLVGYGQTEDDENNTLRRQVERSVEALDDEIVVYSQEDGRGSCFGDSGGPGFVEIGGEERVGSVVSGGVSDQGEEECSTGFGIGMRASAYEDFIQDALNP